MNRLSYKQAGFVFSLLSIVMLCVPGFSLSAATSAEVVNSVGERLTENKAVSRLVIRPTYTASLDHFDDSNHAELDSLIEKLRSISVSNIEVIGHTDSVQIRKRSQHLFVDNRALSLARAQSVANYLKENLTLADEQVTVKGFGGSMPLASNATRSGRAQNRRIEIVAEGAASLDSVAVAGVMSQSEAEQATHSLQKINPSTNSLEKSLNRHGNKISLSLKGVDIAEVMNMLSRKQRVNILMSKGVTGEVTINLYDMSLDEVIRSIANAAGYAAERRNGNYYISSHDDTGKYARSGLTQLRAFKVQYSQTSEVEAILKNHLSSYGKITALKERNLLIVEDTPEFLQRIENLLIEVDQQPKQILIEAKILEIILDDSETFGLDWKKLFTSGEGAGSFGGQGLAPGGAGFFLQLVTPNIELSLNALNTEGRVRTLSTPKLLALENQEASVVIGDRIGYKVTTTINQVTTESIQFLESGVILKVTPSVDRQGQIMLDIHPEVSTGTVSDGIPSQSTTEVTTQLLVPNGQTVFIGGLMKLRQSETHDSIPGLGSLPIIGRLFGTDETISLNTETVVMITPYIIERQDPKWASEELKRVNRIEKELTDNLAVIEKKIEPELASQPESTPWRNPDLVNKKDLSSQQDVWADEDEY